MQLNKETITYVPYIFILFFLPNYLYMYKFQVPILIDQWTKKQIKWEPNPPIP